MEKRTVAQNLLLQFDPKFIGGGPGIQLAIDLRNKGKLCRILNIVVHHQFEVYPICAFLKR